MCMCVQYVVSPAFLLLSIHRIEIWIQEQAGTVEMDRICRLPLVASSTLGPVFQQLRSHCLRLYPMSMQPCKPCHGLAPSP